jgi:hypothetical protein
MLYAFEERLTSVIGAADTLVEFEDFIRQTDSSVVNPEVIGVKIIELATLMDMLTEDNLQGFKKAPVIVEHLSPEARAAFNEKFSVTVIKRNALLDKHEDMLLKEIPDPHSADALDDRPIEEIYELDQNDSWDKRSDEEKAEDAEDRKKMREAQKKGDISGDSFGPNPNRKKRKKTTDDTGSNVHVTDVKGYRNEDGEVEIDSVIAVKGLHDPRPGERDYDELKAAPHDPNRKAATLADSIAKKPSLVDALQSIFDAKTKADQDIADVDSEEIDVDVNGVIAIYHKVEVIGAKLATIRGLLLESDAEIDLNHTAIVQRNNAAGCWFAFIRQIQAEESAKVLADSGFTVETYAVNDAGERLAPKGIQVIDQKVEGEEHPRPWNFRSKEIRKMTAAERRANDKTVKPGEFIFCGNYEGAVQGTVIYITPKSYFKEKGVMWDKPLNIEKLLPLDFSEVAPGIYRSKSRDWNHISFDLNSRGFKENLMLQIALNMS